MGKITIVNYARMLCQFETLDKIRGRYFEAYLLHPPIEIQEEIKEVETIKEEIIEKINEFRKDNPEVFTKLADVLHIVDGKINTIEFADAFDKVGIKMVQKPVNIDHYIKEAYKRFDKAWKLDVREFDIKAVKKLETEQILDL